GCGTMGGPVAERGAIPVVEGGRDAAVHYESARRSVVGCRERERVSDAFVNMDHIRLAFPNQTGKLARASKIEFAAHGQSGERDAGIFALRLQHVVRPAHDGDVMSALAQSGRRLEHLVHRAGVELIEFENLENAHWCPVTADFTVRRTARRALSTIIITAFAALVVLNCTTDNTSRR